MKTITDIRALVAGSRISRVAFRASQNGLLWYCSCHRKPQRRFCRHCVALALTVLTRQEN